MNFILSKKSNFMTPHILFSLSGAIHDWKGTLITIFIGAVAGLLAQLLTPGRGYGMLITIILGIVGGWLGNILFKNYLSFTANPLINQIICATAGAFILAILVNLLIGNDKKDKTGYRV